MKAIWGLLSSSLMLSSNTWLPLYAADSAMDAIKPRTSPSAGPSSSLDAAWATATMWLLSRESRTRVKRKEKTELMASSSALFDRPLSRLTTTATGPLGRLIYSGRKQTPLNVKEKSLLLSKAPKSGEG